MIFHVPLLVLATLLLWFPRQWMRLGLAFFKRRRRRAEATTATGREPGDPRLSFRDEFGKFRNYLDLLRAAAGSLALLGGMGGPAGMEPGAGASREAVWGVIVLRGLILLLGLLIQTVRYEKNKISFYPPIFYLAGLSVGLCDVRGAAFAFALVWAFNPMFGGAQGFLAVYAITMVAFGHFFARGGDLSAAQAGFLALVPVVLSLLGRRPLVVFTRKATS